MFASRVQFCDTHGIISANQYGGKDRKGTCVMKKKVLGLAVGIILVLAFGMAVVSCPVGNELNGSNGSGSDSSVDYTNFDTTSSVYDFQAFLASRQLGILGTTGDNNGAWPVWNAGQPRLEPIPNHLSIVEEPSGGRALRVPFGGSHGVEIRLIGADSIGANIGYMLEIHGRIVLVGTNNAPTSTPFPQWPFQLAAIRSAGGGEPRFNLVTRQIIPPSPNFVIQRVIRPADHTPAAGGWPPGSTLRLVNEPSNGGTVMYVTDIQVFRPLPQDPD